MKLIFLLWGALLWGSLAHADGGSRVGGGSGTGSHSFENFEVKIPSDFRDRRPIPSGVRLEGPISTSIRIGANGIPQLPTQQKIDLMKFNKQIPEISHLSKSELLNWFDKNNWEKMNSGHCGVARIGKNKDLITAIVMWDTGEGYVISADNTDSVEKKVAEIVSSTKLKVKDCPWK